MTDGKPSLPSLLPSSRYCTLVLLATRRSYPSIMGSNYAQPLCARRYVLVLFPERSWRSHLVEGMDHPPSDCAICS
jgi:hypothetical protein